MTFCLDYRQTIVFLLSYRLVLLRFVQRLPHNERVSLRRLCLLFALPTFGNSTRLICEIDRVAANGEIQRLQRVTAEWLILNTSMLSGYTTINYDATSLPRNGMRMLHASSSTDVAYPLSTFDLYTYQTELQAGRYWVTVVETRSATLGLFLAYTAIVVNNISLIHCSAAEVATTELAAGSAVWQRQCQGLHWRCTA